MHSGPYEWKQALLGGRVRIEFKHESVTISTKLRTDAVSFSEIENVYFSNIVLGPFAHSRFIEVEPSDGRYIKFGISGYGPPSGHNAEEAGKAIQAFLFRYAQSYPEADVLLGTRPRIWEPWLWTGITAGILVYLAYAIRLDDVLDPDTKWLSYAIASVMLVIGMALGYRNFAKKKPILIRELLNELGA